MGNLWARLFYFVTSDDTSISSIRVSGSDKTFPINLANVKFCHLIAYWKIALLV